MNRKLTKFAIMTNKEIYKYFLQQLKLIYNANEAGVITDRVFEKVAGLQRFDIIKNPDQIANKEILIQLGHCIQSLLQHKPVQYVLGEAWFCKMKLAVNEQVLIPRPETEELVQLVVEDYKAVPDKNKISAKKMAKGEGLPITMLDIGTGSGCIAIALKKSLPGIIMQAIDVSEGALSLATENAVNQQVDIQFLSLDFLEEDSWKGLPVFDVIISNPPYIPLNEKAKLDKNVTDYEPHTALFVPDNAPLLFYEKIADFGKEHLKRNGKIYVEIHEDFGKETAKLFEQFYWVVIKKDLFGKDRMIIAEKRLPAL